MSRWLKKTGWVPITSNSKPFFVMSSLFPVNQYPKKILNLFYFFHRQCEYFRTFSSDMKQKILDLSPALRKCLATSIQGNVVDFSKTPLRKIFESTTCIDNIQFLIENCFVDVDSPVNNNGESLLHLSVAKMKLKTVELLLKLGANPNYIAGHYQSPLNCACANGCLDTIDILLQYGASVHIRSTSGQTCVFFARHDFMSLKKLKEYHADLTDIGLPSHQPSLLFYHLNFEDMFKKCFLLGVNPGVRNDLGEDILMAAACERRLTLFNWLLSFNCFSIRQKIGCLKLVACSLFLLEVDEEPALYWQRAEDLQREYECSIFEHPESSGNRNQIFRLAANRVADRNRALYTLSQIFGLHHPCFLKKILAFAEDREENEALLLCIARNGGGVFFHDIPFQLNSMNSEPFVKTFFVWVEFAEEFFKRICEHILEPLWFGWNVVDTQLEYLLQLIEIFFDLLRRLDTLFGPICVDSHLNVNRMDKKLKFLSEFFWSLVISYVQYCFEVHPRILEIISQIVSENIHCLEAPVWFSCVTANNKIIRPHDEPFFPSISTLDLFYKCGFDINQKSRIFKTTLLSRAIFDCIPEVVLWLLNHGAHIDLQSAIGTTPLAIFKSPWIQTKLKLKNFGCYKEIFYKMNQVRSLKCLAAAKVPRHLICCEVDLQLPKEVHRFLMLHCK